MERLEKLLTTADIGRRVDRLAASLLGDAPPSRLHKLFRKSCVSIGGIPVGPSDRVSEPGRLTIDLSRGRQRAELLPNRRIRLAFLAEDPSLLVVVKPAGLVMTPGPGHGSDTLIHALLARAPELNRLGADRSYGFVQRLDRETSGLLVVARTVEAYENLRAQFAARTVQKQYRALVEGRVEGSSGVIKKNLARPSSSQSQADIDTDEGVDAETAWRLSSLAEATSELICQPKTGRTHQIRAHLASIGHPVLGDTRYGAAADRAPRVMLHAERLRFTHPTREEAVQYEAEAPSDYRKAARRLGFEPSPERDADRQANSSMRGDINSNEDR